MKDKALFELGEAEKLLSHWRLLPGLQVKELITHLVNALNTVSAYILNDASSVIERDYLALSSVRLFDDEGVESEFYESYYYLMSLLRKDIQRIDEDNVRIVSSKQVFNAGRDYFQGLIGNVRNIVDNAFQSQP